MALYASKIEISAKKKKRASTAHIISLYEQIFIYFLLLLEQYNILLAHQANSHFYNNKCHKFPHISGYVSVYCSELILCSD